jgi:hypothetical protein
MKPIAKSIQHLSHTFPIHEGLKQEDALSPMFFNFALECVIRKIHENQSGLKLNGTHQFLVYADDVNLLGDIINTKMKNKEALTDASKFSLKAYTEKLSIC